MKKLLGLFAVLFVSVANAGYVASGDCWRVAPDETVVFESQEAYCSYVAANWDVKSLISGYSYGGMDSYNRCVFKRSSGEYTTCASKWVNKEPNYPPKEEQAKDCNANEGKVTSLSVFSGWASMNPDGTLKDFKGTGNVPNSVCYKGCSFALLDNTPVPNTSGTKKDATGEWLPVYSSYQYMGFNQTCESETDLEKPTTDAPQTEAEKEPETKEEKPLEEQKDKAGCSAAGGAWKSNDAGGGSCVSHADCAGSGGSIGTINGQNVCVGSGSGSDGESGSGSDGESGSENGSESGGESGSENGQEGGSENGSGDSGNGTGTGGTNGKGSGEGVGSDSENEGSNFCKKNPESWMCSLGKPATAGELQSNEATVNLDIGAVSMPNYCPPNRSFQILGKTHTVELAMLCDAADTARPFVLLAASIASMLIVIRGLRA